MKVVAINDRRYVKPAFCLDKCWHDSKEWFLPVGAVIFSVPQLVWLAAAFTGFLPVSLAVGAVGGTAGYIMHRRRFSGIRLSLVVEDEPAHELDKAA